MSLGYRRRLPTRASNAQVGVNVHGQGVHSNLRGGDAHKMVSLRFQEILHGRLVLARLRHRCCKYILLITGLCRAAFIIM